MNRFRTEIPASFAAALCLLILAVPAAVQAMDADELIAKNLEAMGGLEKIQSVQTAKTTGKFMAQGMEFPFTLTQKRPHKMQIVAQVMGMEMIQSFDGEAAWSINPMTGNPDAQPMSEIEEKGFRLQADMDGSLVDYAAKGYTATYIGEEDVEGTPTHRLSLVVADDLVVDYFMDAEYFLVIKQMTRITLDENEITTSTYLSDFQEVDGLVTPYATETRMNDQVVNQIMIETVEYGVEVDDAIFVKPEATPPPPAAPEGE